MKRLQYSLLISFLFPLIANAQFSSIPVKVTDNIPKLSSAKLGKKSAANPKNCERDTVQYPRYKASRLFFVNMRQGYSLGQFYGTPQEITVHGFTFYAFVNANPPSPKNVRVICNLYRAGADSLPSGIPLRSDTVSVDSTLGGGLLSNVVKHAVFKTPITLNFPYILTVESDSSSLNTSVVLNDWTSHDGDSTNFMCGTVTGRWYRGLSLNIGGNVLDADVLLHPHVTYKFGTDFNFKDCSEFMDTIKFKNQYRSNVSGSYFYNLYSFYPYDWFCHQWNYGDQPFSTYVEEGARKYTAKNNYNVRLVSRVFQYHGGICYDTTIKTIHFQPRKPSVLSNTNICRGDSANISVSTDAGAVIKWYKNPADTTVIYTGNTLKLGIPQKNDTFYLRAINANCVSTYSTLIVRVHDYPVNPEIQDDSICTGAKANLRAESKIGITDWYLDSTSFPIFSGNILQTGVLNSDLSYYVRSNNNGCMSPSFQKVTAYVDNSFAPEDPEISKDTIICLRPQGVATLKAKNQNNDSIYWYTAASGGKSISAGNTYVFNAISKGENTLYVEASKSGCASSRLPIRIRVSDYPAISNIFPDVKCKGDTALVGALLSAPGNLYWYDQQTGGNLLGTGSVIQYFTDKSTTLYAEAGEDGCINPNRSPVSITINQYDDVSNVNNPLLCGSQEALVVITAGNSEIKWYEDAEATKKVFTGPVFKTPKLLVSTNYYYTLEKDGCISPVKKVFLEILPLPIPGFSDSIITGHRIRFKPYATTNVKYNWDMGDGNKYTSQMVTHGYALYGTYKVQLKVSFLSSGCADSFSKDVVFDFSGIETRNLNGLSIYPNPSKGIFTIRVSSYDQNTVLKVYASNGKLLWSQALKSKTEEIDLTGLPKGIYSLLLTSEKTNQYKKIIIE
ncbi:MAG: T9SS type A sorting domain-containing protein [Flavobacteriales bacterium]|nr:T9SS type A sorting domain-containing protein [Flavobacteriales bacterium]